MLNKSDKVQILRYSKIFAGMDDEILEQVADTLEVVKIKKGEILFDKGDTGTAMYIVINGQVRVHDGAMVYRRAGKGEVFGEMAALDASVRSASITADVETTLFRLEQSALYQLMDGQPRLVRSLIHVLCEYVRNCSEEWQDDYYQREKLEHELSIGRKIQAGFLPEELPQMPGWQVAACFKAARQVAGDFYDVFELPYDGKIGFVLGDVCDKGVGAALFMTLFRSLIRAVSTSDNILGSYDASCQVKKPTKASTEDLNRLEATIMMTNNYIARTHGSSSMFATLFLAFLNPDDGSFIYVNGGHEPAVICNKNGIKARLERTGPAVGLFPCVDFEIREAQLEPGDTIMIYSDGVPDAHNNHMETYGAERLASLIADAAKPAPDLLNYIEAIIEAFTAGADQFDDITMLAVSRDL